jgi:hypothetical protein
MQIISQNVIMLKDLHLYKSPTVCTVKQGTVPPSELLLRGSERYLILVWKKSELLVNMRNCIIVCILYMTINATLYIFPRRSQTLFSKMHMLHVSAFLFKPSGGVYRVPQE